MMIKPIINKLLSPSNFTKGDISRIKYIVLHYVGALGSAEANCLYSAAGQHNASAHYYVGHEGEIWQSVEDADIAWHCGADTYKHEECRNSNSIGVELCVRKQNGANLDPQDDDWYFEDATVEAAAELVRYLMEKYKVPIKNVLRHFDVTGKVCPNPFVKNNTAHTWDGFKRMLSDTENVIWEFLSGRGFNDYAVAGIMGNLYAESGLNPVNLQDTYSEKLHMSDEKYTEAVDNGSYADFINDGAGYGLAQWTYCTRKEQLLNFAKNAGVSVGNINMQMTFLCQELQRCKNAWKALETADSVLAASNAVLREYEKPADQSLDVQQKRAGYGQEYYNRHAAQNNNCK